MDPKVSPIASGRQKFKNMMPHEDSKPIPSSIRGEIDLHTHQIEPSDFPGITIASGPSNSDYSPSLESSPAPASRFTTLDLRPRTPTAPTISESEKCELFALTPPDHEAHAQTPRRNNPSPVPSPTPARTPALRCTRTEPTPAMNAFFAYLETQIEGEQETEMLGVTWDLLHGLRNPPWDLQWVLDDDWVKLGLGQFGSWVGEVAGEWEEVVVDERIAALEG